ncbi:thiamine phosphate synthase [Kangiella koreensis]|uniref:Thiamine-phosphate pyrophosphorylase n=1 Tax=Kangiella koreensis (strain DSM 16069 / JCM 12317 / KCTC 12182 / SW-125) TaxID=523791 RepID=C7R6N5_KANKD|nr:thiamine phosphate synthase [Kangiella koreensis]ACV25551.1 thiamine-phosphate pyrophosphorylase [Kangiella koreensis DSM 16069]
MKVTGKPVVWSYAGLDNSGMAGQVADIRTIEALGAHACCVTTALTAQNSQRVVAINPSAKEQLQSQLEALQELGQPNAIKVGLLPSEESIQLLITYLEKASNPIQLVFDPVIESSSGTQFMPDEVLEQLEKLLPLVTVFTPNIDELARITGQKIQSIDDIESQAKKLLESGTSAVLVKGGHWPSEQASDFFVNRQHQFWLHSDRQETDNTRGTGCVLSSAIATALALDYSVEDAVVIGKMVLNQGLRHSYGIRDQKGPLAVQSWPGDERDMPRLTKQYALNEHCFPCLKNQALDLYPVVDSAKWLERLLPLGIPTIQLRVKDLKNKELENEIVAAIKIAKQNDAKLFINDYWQLAIKHGAFGVHLGQEDLDDADIAAISKAGLHLGISTHCFYEVARAHAIQPSYLACGPVYHTDSKQMPWIPHGIESLGYWNNVMQSYPWVAIGGINADRIAEVASTGVSGIAMISAITRSHNPEQTATNMMQLIEQHRPLV